MTNPYNDIDERTERLKKLLFLILNQLRLKVDILSSDEQVKSQVETAFKQLYDKIITEYVSACKKTYPKTTEDDVKKWLEEYYIITGYVFINEWERKTERYLEEILAFKSADKSLFGADAAKLQRKTANLFSRQIEEYGIFVIDKAMLEQFEEEGVKRLKWNAQQDKKTCSACRERDNKIYNINNLPTKAHYNCRCYYTPVGDEEK